MHRQPGPAKRPEETPDTKLAHSGRSAPDAVPSTKKRKTNQRNRDLYHGHDRETYDIDPHDIDLTTGGSGLSRSHVGDKAAEAAEQRGKTAREQEISFTDDLVQAAVDATCQPKSRKHTIGRPFTRDKNSNGGGMTIKGMGMSWTDSGKKDSGKKQQQQNWAREDSRSRGSYGQSSKRIAQQKTTPLPRKNPLDFKTTRGSDRRRPNLEAFQSKYDRQKSKEYPKYEQEHESPNWGGLPPPSKRGTGKNKRRRTSAAAASKSPEVVDLTLDDDDDADADADDGLSQSQTSQEPPQSQDHPVALCSSDGSDDDDELPDIHSKPQPKKLRRSNKELEAMRVKEPKERNWERHIKKFPDIIEMWIGLEKMEGIGAVAVNREFDKLTIMVQGHNALDIRFSDLARFEIHSTSEPFQVLLAHKKDANFDHFRELSNSTYLPGERNNAAKKMGFCLLRTASWNPKGRAEFFCKKAKKWGVPPQNCCEVSDADIQKSWKPEPTPASSRPTRSSSRAAASASRRSTPMTTRRTKHPLSDEEANKTLTAWPPDAPKGKGAFEITKGDRARLDEGEFLNDVIINFYLKYIETELLEGHVKEKIHIFTTFFFKRFTQGGKSIPALTDGFAQVKSWTKNVDIFSKDFLVVPINEYAHWYLAIICYPNMIANGEHVDETWVCPDCDQQPFSDEKAYKDHWNSTHKVHKQKEEDGVFAAEEAAAQEKADRDHAIARVANAENKTEAHTISDDESDDGSDTSGPTEATRSRKLSRQGLASLTNEASLEKFDQLVMCGADEDERPPSPATPGVSHPSKTAAAPRTHGSAVDDNDDSDDSWVPADDDAPSSQQQQCIKHPAASACVGKEAATMTVSDDEDQPLAKQEGGSAAAANGAQDQEGDNAIAAVDDLSTDAAPSSKPASHAPSPFDERVLDTTDDDDDDVQATGSSSKPAAAVPENMTCADITVVRDDDRDASVASSSAPEIKSVQSKADKALAQPMCEDSSKSRSSSRWTSRGKQPSIEEAFQESPKLAPKRRQRKKIRPPAAKRICPKRPCILMFDSLGGTRTAAAKNLKLYLTLAWKKRAKDDKKEGRPGAAAADGPSDEEIPQALKSLKIFEAKSGQQDNHCDCGVYVLQYIQEFFGAADGNKLAGTNTTTMLEQWFPDTIKLQNCDKKQIVKKRTDIRTLIDDLAKATKMAKKEVKAKGRAEPEASGEPEGGGGGSKPWNETLRSYGEANDHDQTQMIDL